MLWCDLQRIFCHIKSIRILFGTKAQYVWYCYVFPIIIYKWTISLVWYSIRNSSYLAEDLHGENFSSEWQFDIESVFPLASFHLKSVEQHTLVSVNLNFIVHADGQPLGCKKEKSGRHSEQPDIVPLCISIKWIPLLILNCFTVIRYTLCIYNVLISFIDKYCWKLVIQYNNSYYVWLKLIAAVNKNEKVQYRATDWKSHKI